MLKGNLLPKVIFVIACLTIGIPFNLRNYNVLVFALLK